MEFLQDIPEVDEQQVPTQQGPDKPVKRRLSEQHKVKLDGIVQKMLANRESDEDIQLVVDDFKEKYGVMDQSKDPASNPPPTNPPIGPKSLVPFNSSDKDFQKWYSKNTVEGLNNIPYSDDLNYDYYSFYSNNNKGDKSAGNPQDHFPDTYKRPGHVTFSNESLYYKPGMKAGYWDGDKYVPISGVDTLRQLQKQADTMPNDVNIGVNMAGDTMTISKDTAGAQKQAEAQKNFADTLNSTAKEWGVDKNDLKDVIKSFPHYDDEGVKRMAKLASENPAQYFRYATGSDIMNTMSKMRPPEDVKMFSDDGSGRRMSSVAAANKINQLMQVGSLDELFQNVPLQQQMINAYSVGDAVSRKKMMDGLQLAQAPLINTADPSVMQQYQESGMGALLNKYQFAGLLTEKLFNPQQYEEDVKMLTYLSSEQGKKDEKDGTYDFKRGAEQVRWKLESMGRENDSRFLSEAKTDLNKKIENLAAEYQEKIKSATSEDEQIVLVEEFNNHPMVAKMTQLESAGIDLENIERTEGQRYPMRTTEAADRMVKEALDETDGFFGSAVSMAKRFPSSIGKIADETVGWISTAMINMLASREVQAQMKLETIGRSKSYDNMFFQPQSYTGVQRPFIVPKKHIKGVQDIFNSDEIPDSQKQGEAMKYLRENQSDITVNPNAGQHNWTFKAGLNSSLDMVAAIAGIGAQSMLMGNVAGGAGKVKNLISAFTPMYMSMQQDMYGKAIANGENDPYLKTSAEAAIVSLAGLINPPAKVMRGMLSKDRVVGKIIAGMDDKTIEGIVSKNKKWVSQVGEFAKGSMKQLGLASAQYGLIAPVAETGFLRNYLGEDVSLSGKLKEGMVNTLVSMSIPSLFHGVQSVRAANVSPMQRLSIYEAALNSKNRIENINQMEKDGQLPEVQAKQMRTIVERAAKALTELPEGKMTEQKRADILYNMVRKEALRGRLKDAKTDLHKSNIEAKISEIDAEISEIKKSKPEQPSSEIKESPEQSVNETSSLSPEEQKVIQAIQETMADSKGEGQKSIYEASKDPAKQKEIIQNLIDQSVDHESFIDMTNIDVLDAVYQLMDAKDAKSSYKTHEELGVNVSDANVEIQPKSGVSVIMPGDQNRPEITTVKGKPLHSVSTPVVKEKISPLSEEPVSQFEGQPSVETKAFDKSQPFTTKNGHSIVLENGELRISDKKGNQLKDRSAIKKAREEYADAFDFSEGQTAAELPEGMTSHEDIKSHVVETSSNPAEIAGVYKQEEPGLSISTKEQMIAEYGVGKINRNSYIELGDRNNIGASKAKTYFDKSGPHIDVVAKEMSDHYGVEITPQDIVDFIDAFPNGSSEALRMKETKVAEQAKAKFKQLTGLDLDSKMAEKALQSEYRKFEKVEQELAQQEYETAEQLQKDYWNSYEETINGPKDSDNRSTTPTEASKEGATAADPEMIGITHAQMDEISREFGFPEYEKSPEKEAAWIEEAKQRVTNGDMPALIERMRNGEMPSAVEQKMVGVYAADLKARLNKDPKNDALLSEFKRLKDLSNIVGGRDVAKSLRARQGIMPVEETPVDYLVRHMEEAKVDVLTEKQKDQSLKSHAEIESATKAYKEKIAKLEADNKRLAAEKHVKKYSKNPKKTKEDFVAERKAIRESISEKLRKSRGQANDVVTAVVDFVKIAPDVARLVKSFAEEGVLKLDDMVKRVHGELKDEIDGITENDVRDLIAGEYNRKLPTRNQLQENLFNLRMEAKLAKELEVLIETGKRPMKERQQRQYNREVTELRRQIISLEKEIANANKQLKSDLNPRQAEEIALKSIKTRTRKQIEAIEEQLRKGNFEPEVKNKVKLDKEARELKDKLIDLQIQRETEMLRERYASESGLQKVGQFGMEIANLPRTIMSSTDLSAPFRQGLVAFVAHPILGIKAMGKMLHAAVSQKVLDRFFFDLRNSEDFHLMEKTGLGITDPLNPKLSAKEEAFMNNIAQRIPVAGRVIKASERAYVLFLNKMRVDVFRQGQKAFEANGRTMENSPELYKAWAGHINDITGRGNLPKIVEGAAPALNAMFFSPRLIASRINLLTNFMNPRWYKKTPIEVRKMYFRDMAAFTVFGLTLAGLSKLALGDDFETDPRSTDFLKYKSGDDRIDVLGGFQQFIRVIAQFAYGEKLRDGKATKLDGKGAFGETRGDVLMRFLRGKLSPNAALITDIVNGRDIMGNEIMLDEWNPKGKKEKGVRDMLGTYLLPMTGTDIKRVFEDKNMRAAGLLALATFGASVQHIEGRSGLTETIARKPSKPKRIRKPKVER